MLSCEVTTCILHQNIFYIATRIFHSNFRSIGVVGQARKNSQLSTVVDIY